MKTAILIGVTAAALASFPVISSACGCSNGGEKTAYNETQQSNISLAGYQCPMKKKPAAAPAKSAPDKSPSTVAPSKDKAAST